MVANMLFNDALAYQCGVYKALANHDIRFDIVSGTSIGALNTAIIKHYHILIAVETPTTTRRRRRRKDLEMHNNKCR
jgi:predicted acylesterase/phospholipase RssA